MGLLISCKSTKSNQAVVTLVAISLHWLRRILLGQNELRLGSGHFRLLRFRSPLAKSDSEVQEQVTWASLFLLCFRNHRVVNSKNAKNMVSACRPASTPASTYHATLDAIMSETATMKLNWRSYLLSSRGRSVPLYAFAALSSRPFYISVLLVLYSGNGRQASRNSKTEPGYYQRQRLCCVHGHSPSDRVCAANDFTCPLSRNTLSRRRSQKLDFP